MTANDAIQKAWERQRKEVTATKVCGHMIMSPVQAYKRRRGKWIPIVQGETTYAPIVCMKREVGHKDDHQHTFVWSNGQKSDA